MIGKTLIPTFVVLALGIFLQCTIVFGHGRLVQPPARGSAWRKGFNVPADYNDNEENCGGFGTQWDESNKGKCGICGDPWDGARENETPGKYATGTIVATYNQGQVIDADVEITSNHKGWIEFRLCENNDIKHDKDQSCFDKHLLEFDGVGVGETRMPLGQGTGVFSYKLRLPAGVTCDQCILQWRYNAGNSWGIDPDTKEGCIGCGAQESFWGCSDIEILSGGGSGDRRPSTTTKATTMRTTRRQTTAAQPMPTPSAGGGHCKSVPPYNRYKGMDKWCQDHCALGHCPPTHCKCN